MKRPVAIFIIATFLLSLSVYGQPVQAEILGSNQSLFYQHLIIRKFKQESRWGFMHVANINYRYNTNIEKRGRPNDVMNQAYVSYSFNKTVSGLAGLFYSNATDIRLSLALQVSGSFRDIFWVLQPRIDVQSRGSFEWMGLVEYRPSLRNRVRLYSRIQWMNNAGPYHHNKSYQRFRWGVDIKNTQVGIGLNIDEYGRNGDAWFYPGVFLRKEFR